MPKEKMDEIIELYGSYMEMRTQNFFDYVLFAPQWWLLIILPIILWSLWALFVDKRRILPIVLVGVLTSAIAMALDDIGMSLMLWKYPYFITHFTTRLDVVDAAIIPVSYMLLYQYARSWKNYLIILVLLSLFGAFIAEPIFVYLRLYVLIGWKYWYSVPCYIAIGVLAKWLVDKLRKSPEHPCLQ